MLIFAPASVSPRDASPVHLDPFSRLASGTFPEQGTQWTRFALRDRPATTAFSIVADGDERVLALEANAGVAAMRHAVRVEPNEALPIAWRWRVIKPATAGRLGAKGTDDFAAAFGESAPAINAVVVAADADDTRSRSLANIGDIVFSR